jgi:TPR repeat protein
VIYWNLAMKHYNPRTMEGYRKSIYWLRKSSKVGYDCWSTLAEAYQELKEYDKAMLWYRRVAKRGDALAYWAEASIADMYAEGQGVLKNYAEAARWWVRAAQHGSRFANYDLGKLYAEGAEGVAPNNCEAYFHLFIAASDNDLSGISQQIIERRDKVAKQLSESEIAKEKERANEWLLLYRKISKVDRLPLPV